MLSREPVAIAAFVRAALLAVMAFGVNLTAEQVAAVMVAVEAGLALVTRALVEPTKKGPPSGGGTTMGPVHVRFTSKEPPDPDTLAKAIRSALPARGFALLVLIPAFALLLSGCAGSLEEARAAGIADRSAGAGGNGTASSPDRCAALDDRRSWYSAATKGFAFAAGGQGLGSIATDDRELRIGLAVGTVVMGAGAALFAQLEGDADEAWARQCSAR